MPQNKPGGKTQRPDKEAVLQEHASLCQAEPAASLLLVDDEPDFVDSLAFRLRTRGLPCLVAYNGEQALALADRPELEVVLLDLSMPGMHGLEVLRHMKARRPDVEVLLLTGAADIAMAAKGMRRGAGDYLVKPVDFTLLLESLAKARQRAGEHRERMRAAEAGKLMALGALAAGVGHEINNPLQLIMQGSEWLCELVEEAGEGKPDFAAMEKTARMLQAQARKAGDITARLLELAHQAKSRRAYTILSRLAHKVCGQMHLRALALGADLTVDLPDEFPPLPCSPAEMEPVLVHLVRNALDAVEAGRPGKGRVLISAAGTEDFLSFSVQDNGEGVSAVHAPHIFEPFYSTRPIGKGAGLGLTLCHSIISALRGSIRWSPLPEGGTVFTVAVPVLKDMAAPQPGGQ